MFADLLSKVQGALNHWTTYKISYAGKISLINSVTFGLEQFWCSTLLLPKGVLRLINKFCKKILWNFEEGQRKLIMKSWASCCSPYQEGRFNIKEILSWNKCVICKWIWGLINQSDGFWNTWNYSYNIKQGDLWTMQKKSTHSESWRSILQVRDELVAMAGSGDNAQGLLQSCVRKGKLRLHLLYDHFRQRGNTLSWTKAAWNRALLPKHSFFLVMAMQRKLATIDQLNIRGFYIVLTWLNMHNITVKLSKEMHWIAGRRACKHWKARWYTSCLGAAVYCLWEERNTRIFSGQEHQFDYVVKRIQYLVKVRLLYVTHPSKEGEIVEALDGC
ncbi:uncharacterized protein LOC141655368 [Silene latifolia]|uniref:uncharacterized protein LOC141655368 n=1 Tax=Silene latifolia TaxID=37657 RepID=UPI003D786CA7